MMNKSPLKWKKGRGKLGLLAPLLGAWRAEADSPMGKVVCTRTFTKVLDGAYVQLMVDWQRESGSYQELALYGVGPEGEFQFWSFTSDKKQSQGRVADVSDLYPQAIGFEAQMPAGLARMAYWPDAQEGFHWVVQAKTKTGWREVALHHYIPVK